MTTSYTTYRLHVFMQGAQPFDYQLHTCRDVDTFAQAEEIARLGHEFDERDGTTTRYELRVWETGRDRSTLAQSYVLS